MRILKALIKTTAIVICFFLIAFVIASFPKTMFVLEILKAKQKENTNNYVVVKCEHTVDGDDTFGFIRYFRPSDIIKDLK